MTIITKVTVVIIKIRITVIITGKATTTIMATTQPLQ